MILIFKGYGLLVPFIFLGCFVLAEIASLVLAERAGNGEWVLGAAPRVRRYYLLVPGSLAQA